MLLRALILLLLCMNVGVSIWWATHREPPQPVLPATEKGVSSLALLGEAEPPSMPDAAELSTAPEALSANSVCLSIGPFSTPADLRRAMNSLMPNTERIQYREVAAVALRGYRVFLPAAGSRAQALATARALSQHGITDYYVVTAGDQQNTVSLGIFRELENASKRHDAVAALGYDPSIEARTEQAPQWWIDLAAKAEFDWRALVPDADLTAEPVPCS
jgi:hypothetical protein